MDHVRLQSATRHPRTPGYQLTDSLAVIESYITHIRIIEDAAFPASPPPPNANPATKKPRLVIVAVRKSGRVRMHKARENANGTFSIGKTWMLDDLSAIQSYTGAVSQTPEEEQQKQWAGGIGFIVTLGKSYYWQANTQKEKQFFIASLVKIYTKYTGGKPDEWSKLLRFRNIGVHTTRSFVASMARPHRETVSSIAHRREAHKP